MPNSSYGQRGRPDASQLAQIRANIQAAAGVRPRQPVAPQALPQQPTNVPPQGQPRQAPWQQAPAPAPYQGAPDPYQAPQFPPAPQAQPQPQVAPWQQVNHQDPHARLPAHPQAQPPVPQPTYPPLADYQQRLGLAQTAAATHQNEATELEARIAALESANHSTSLQKRISDRLKSDPFLSDDDANYDADTRAARIAQISFEETMLGNANPQHVGQPPQPVPVRQPAPQPVQDPMMERMVLERQLQEQLGYTMHPHQVQVIAKVASEIGGDLGRAAAIAQVEYPQLFGAQPGFQPGPQGHEMNAPSGGTSPNRLEPDQRDDYDERRQYALASGRVATEDFVRGEAAGRLFKHFPELHQGIR